MASTPSKQVIGGATFTVTRVTADGGNNSATDVGGLVGGITITPSANIYHPDIEQELFPGKYTYTDKEFKIDTEIAEPTLENLQIGWDIKETITGTGPKVMNFGYAAFRDYIPAEMLTVITMYSPISALGSGLRSITLNKAVLATPGAMTISKRAVATVKASFMGKFDGTKLGTISDVTT